MANIDIEVAEVYSSEEIYRLLGVSTTRGIKYKGRADHPNCVVLITDLNGWSESNPYHDRLEENSLYYTGEGLEAEQELVGGNLALSNYLIYQFPIHILSKIDTDEYKYLGLSKLDHMAKELQYDLKGKIREVFIYKIKLKEYNLYNNLENKFIANKDILNFEEASQLLQISTRTLTEILKHNQVPGRKLGRQWHFSRKHLIEWIASGVSQDEY